MSIFCLRVIGRPSASSGLETGRFVPWGIVLLWGLARRCTEGGVARREALHEGRRCAAGLRTGGRKKGAEKARAGWRFCQNNLESVEWKLEKLERKLCSLRVLWSRSETKRNETWADVSRRWVEDGGRGRLRKGVFVLFVGHQSGPWTT
jgi:hypothetical protein